MKGADNWLYFFCPQVDGPITGWLQVGGGGGLYPGFIIFADQVFIDLTFCGIFVCGPLQSFVVNVCTL